MRNQRYDWEDIISCTVQLITELIKKGEEVPKKFPELYKKFAKEYSRNDKRVPPKETFIRVIRNKLQIANNKILIQADLYRLTGMYKKMTLDLLADGTNISSSNNASWLFVRLQSCNIPTNDRNSYFYYLSTKLKEKFKSDIIFISFDIDTIVILCADDDAKKRVQSYFNLFKKEK